jgi:hypothetical protein
MEMIHSVPSLGSLSIDEASDEPICGLMLSLFFGFVRWTVIIVAGILVDTCNDGESTKGKVSFRAASYHRTVTDWARATTRPWYNRRVHCEDAGAPAGRLNLS